MGSLTIVNACIVNPEGISKPSTVKCSGSKIIFVKQESFTRVPDSALDAQGKYIVPGLIDIHMHGIKGYLANNGSEDLSEISRVLPQYGVTGFLPAITPSDDDIELLNNISSVVIPGAQMSAIFLEGHFLKLTGAISGINPDYTLQRVIALQKAANSRKIVFAVSPEIPGISELLPYMTSCGLPAFITHTAADALQTSKAIAGGACHATHLGNVFPYSGDKEPGVRGCGALEAVLAEAGCSADIILDGEHVDPLLAKIILKCKGEDKLCLISDSNICAGLDAGTFKGISGTEVTVKTKGAPARMSANTSTPGLLAGSSLTLDMAVKNAVNMLGVPLNKAVKMASANPAAVLGIADKKGSIMPGYDADFFIMDENYTINSCYIGGQAAYIREKSPV